jgi:hypothetical protein
LVVVGPDPPISGAELELVKDVRSEAGEFAVILNKVDQVSSAHLLEVTEFTRNMITTATHEPVLRVFAVSALERLTGGSPTRDWDALESYLRHLSATARERLVGHAGERAVGRLSRRVAHELAQREDALRRPLVEIEERVARLSQALAALDQTLLELRFQFDAGETDLGVQFERQRSQFAESTRDLHQQLLQWIDGQATSGPTLRQRAFEEADRLAARAVQQWLDASEAEANRMYQAMAERFVRAANDYIARVAVDADDIDVDELPVDVGFRARRQFYFTHLMHATGGTPLTWLTDRFAPRALRRTQVARAATAWRTISETARVRVAAGSRRRFAAG